VGRVVREPDEDGAVHTHVVILGVGGLVGADGLGFGEPGVEDAGDGGRVGAPGGQRGVAAATGRAAARPSRQVWAVASGLGTRPA